MTTNRDVDAFDDDGMLPVSPLAGSADDLARIGITRYELFAAIAMHALLVSDRRVVERSEKNAISAPLIDHKGRRMGREAEYNRALCSMAADVADELVKMTTSCCRDSWPEDEIVEQSS